MVASHGLTHGGVTFVYKDRAGYRDIIESTDPFIRSKDREPLIQAMITIGNQFIANLPNPRPLVAQWFKDATGLNFPVAE